LGGSASRILFVDPGQQARRSDLIVEHVVPHPPQDGSGHFTRRSRRPNGAPREGDSD
jgi:hypothetical protein